MTRFQHCAFFEITGAIHFDAEFEVPACADDT